jgi:hypothetical protein
MSFAENLATGTLADGFTGLGNLFPGEDLHYAFDVILGAPTAPVPEPGSLWLLVSAALAGSAFQKIRKAHDHEEQTVDARLRPRVAGGYWEILCRAIVGSSPRGARKEHR